MNELKHRHLGIFVAGAAFLAVLPLLLSAYLVSQLSLALTYAMAILGLNLLLGFGGQVCLAQGAFFACGAYTTAILSSRYGIAPLMTLPFSVAVTACVGVAIGLPALRLPGLQLAVVTFGIAAVVPQLLLKFSGITGGTTGISVDQGDAPAWFTGSFETWLYFLCLAGVGLCVLVMGRLVGGGSGRTLRALRDNALIAEALGVDLTRTRLAVFAISSAFAGLGGGLYAILNAYVSPQSFQATKSLDILVGTIVGGTTSISGAFIGAIFVLFVPEWASDINPALGALIYGVGLIAVMLVPGHRLGGSIRDGIQRLQKLLRSRSKQAVGLTDANQRRGNCI